MSAESAVQAMIRRGLETPVLKNVVDPDDVPGTVVRLHQVMAGEMPGWANLSSGERVKVRVLLDAWNGSGGATLHDVFCRLDVPNRVLCLRVMEEALTHG